ncbi:hypothetical protein CRM22_010418 [Opisthorchis felineus]|uniref:Nucleolar pre-ribosomal-associated protein 1 C-terminal domain-containing protein n=1 Tax=Opisthorchis felineus TaxID=147828 RepID=A0A4S2L490_OPIFE|nr:hypothetical protein CRM22_010418 [Opisthorchis felineus]
MPKRTSRNEGSTVAKKSKILLNFELIGNDLTVLSKFVELLHQEDDMDELIHQALLSPTVMDILSFLDSGVRRKSSELTTIFQALYVLILRGVGFEAHNPIALELAEGILEDLRFSTCLRGLSVSQGAETMKSALRLLAATAAASVDLARGLLKLLNFENQEMIQCSRRRNTADACDVRTCFLNLVGVFVFKENNALLRELVSKKGVFWLVLSESYIDKYSNVILILQMLRKIVDNSTISKTQKVNLFNKNTLKQMLYLFSWRGEAVTISDALSRDQLDNTHPHLSSIRSTLYELLLILHTSTRFGLVFAGRHREVDTLANGLIFSALTSPPMEAAYADPLRSQLVVESMCASPDVIRPYLDHVAPFLQPRASSSNWFSMMELVSTVFKACKVYLVSWFMRALDQWPNPEQVSKVIVDSCFLSPKLVEPLGNALHFEEDSDVVVKADQLMTLLRANILILLTWLSTNERLNTPTGTLEKEQLIQQIRQLVFERMPTTEWMRRFEHVFNKQRFDVSVLEDQVLPQNQEPLKETVTSDPTTTGLNRTMHCAPDPDRDRTSLHTLPKDVRKLLKYLLIPEDSDGEQLSDKVLRSLQKLPGILNTCISQYFDVYAVHRCLARAVYLARTHSVKEFKAKRVLKIILSQPSFTTVLKGKDSMSDCVEESNRSGPASYEEQFFLRDSLLDLLLEITRSCPRDCSRRIPALWLLAGYNATLHPTDQKILQILFLMNSCSKTLMTHSNGFSEVPVVWGPSVYKHYQFNFVGGAQLDAAQLPQPVVFHQPGLMSLFGCVSDDQLFNSALHFPMSRKWLGQSSSRNYNIPVEDMELLDPCFIMHTLHHYLSLCNTMTSEPSLPYKGNLDQFLRAFYSRNAVAFAVAGLSSYSKHLRSMSRTVIAKYRELLGSWQSTRAQANKKGTSGTTLQLFPERVQIMFILDTLRNSLASGGGRAIGGNGRRRWMFSSALDTGGRLTRVHANFFIRSLQLLGKPENHLYQSVWNCFLSKPALDLNEVPDFLRTFFSTSTQYRMERQWITRLCAESVGDTADYLVMEKSRVFKHCLNAYSSTSSETSFQLNVLKLIASATKQPRLVHALIRFHALPLWLWRHMLVPCPVSHAAQFRTIIDNMSKVICSGSQESPASQLLPLLTEEFEKVHDVTTMSTKQNDNTR